MENIIKYAVECDSLYGVAALIIVTTLIITLAVLALKALFFVFPYVYKIVCKICNTIKDYHSIHTKIGTDDVLIETDLNR